MPENTAEWLEISQNRRILSREQGKRMRLQSPALNHNALLGLSLALASLFLIGVTDSARAQTEETYSVDLAENNSTIPNTFPWAIEQVNAGASTANTISFTNLLLQNLSVPITQALPSLSNENAGRTELNVILNASSAPEGFEILGEGAVDDDFNILDIQNANVEIVDLKISGGHFNVATDSVLEFNDTGDRAVTDIIKGGGKLIKSGSQVLTLEGQSEYTGGTEIKGGTLKGDRKGLAATSSAFVFNAESGESDRGTLLFSDADNATDWTWNGEISGDGNIRKEGASTLVLDGNGFAHTGLTYVDSGTLRSTVARLGAANTELANSTRLEIDGAGELSQTITGQGALVKIGAGELKLSGSQNAFSGGLLVEEGAVEGDSNTIPGDIVFGTGGVNDLQVIFEQNFSGEHSGSITGNGNLFKRGSGTLTLNGAVGADVNTNLDTGQLTIRSSSFASSISSSLNTTIELNPIEANSTFSGAISGGASVLKSGTGSITLTGTQSYAGVTEVSSGIMVIQNSLSATSGTTINEGGTLEVNSASDGQEIFLNGALNALGTLSVTSANDSLRTGDGLAFGDGSTLEVVYTGREVGSTPIISNSAVTGTLINMFPDADSGCNDCVLLESNVSIDPDVISNKDNWGRTGATLKVEQVQILDSKKITFDLVQDASAIGQAAKTQNQISTAPSLEYLYEEGSKEEGPATRVYNIVNGLLPSEYPSALDEMAGESLAAFANAREGNAQQFSHALWQRFRSSEYTPGWYDFKRDESSDPTPPVSASGSSSKATASPRYAGWAQPFGVFAKNDGRDRASNIKSRAYGIIGGVDYALPGSLGLKVGGALGYTRYSVFSESLSDMQGQANTYQLALYGAWQSRRFHVGISGRYGYTNMRSERKLSLFDGVTADARFSGQEGGAMIEIGATLGDPTFFTVRPLASFRYDRFTQGSFRETGAGALSLEVASQDYTSLLTTLGARIAKLYTLNEGFGIEPEIRLGWTYQAGDKRRPITATTYTVAGSPTFTTYGAEADRNAIWVGAGYVMRTSENVRVGLNYDAYIGKYYTQQVVNAELQILW